MRKQKGLSLVTMIILGIVLGFVLLLGFKVVPVYTEYFSVKAALKSLANEKAGAPPAEIRDGFYKHMQIDNISSLGPDDLDISEDKSGTSISAKYQAKVKVAGNVSLLFDFEAEAHHGDTAQ